MTDDKLDLDKMMEECEDRIGWKYILDDEHNVIGIKDLMVWAKWFEEASTDKARVVAQDQVGDSFVSTVFLGLDHNWSLSGPPIVFETMVFGGIDDGRQWRYCTWKSAEAGHKKMVATIKKRKKK
jgi:hypothetical protein